MARTKLGDTEVTTNGDVPAVGETLPKFELAKQDLSTTTLEDFAGKKKVLNIFPSVETRVCAASVRAFYERTVGRTGTVVLNISADLPFSAKNFCGVQGIEDAITLSTFRSTFAEDYGVKMLNGAFVGLCARVVIVADENNVVRHVEVVPSIGEEPDYEAALAALG